MVKEYKVEPPEGPRPQPASLMREFQSGEITVDFGGLEREDFDYLGNWMFLNNSNPEWEIAYRVGLKNDFTDTDGDPATLALHFYAPIVARGARMEDDAKKDLATKLENLLRMFTMQTQQAGYGNDGNMVSAFVDLPDWMMGELREIITS